MIYLITVNYYSTELIAKLLASIQAQSSASYQFVIINNSPDDRLLQTLKEDSILVLEAGDNLGFGGGCNLGLNWVYAQDKEAIAWLINPDATFPEGALEQAINFCTLHPYLSIIGTIVEEPGGNIWFAGGEFNPENGRIIAENSFSNSTDDYIETSWITGCSLLLNLKKFPSCPQFDPDFFLYYEDFDFCRRYAQQGHTVAVTNQIRVIHQPSSITSRNPSLKFEHSTYSYLLALTKHTRRTVVLYRLGRILFHALRASLVEPEKAIAIIKGVFSYVVRVRSLGKSTID
ncbi:MAG: glycosyltransferase family 2 protein [Leptolyngbyaceae cyanobacterium RU_5_1]|nr:glycosyltransferase family 2 protein [Leptolyngbyaceae cyanobacterium RU_5_1]